MNWSGNLNISGWYWIKGLDCIQPWLISHHKHKDEWWIMDTGQGSDTLITEDMHLEFSGPLEPPE